MASSVGDLVVNLTTQIAQFNDGFNKAADTITSFAQDVQKSAKQASDAVDGIVKAFGAIAAVATVGIGIKGLTDLVTGAIDAQAQLSKLAQSTGATVESLSAMKTAATLTGTGIDQVANGLEKFSKAIITAQSGTGAAAQALEALGFSAKTFATQFESSDQALLAVAQRLNDYSDGIGKTAAAQELLGKSGAQLLPFLTELAQRGTDAAKVTTQQAAVAEDLSKAWIELTSSSKGLWNTIATQITPALDGLVRGFLAVLNQGGGLKGFINGLASDGTLASWAQQGAVIIAKLADSFVDGAHIVKGFIDLFLSVGDIVAGVARQVAGGLQILTGNITGGLATVKAGTDIIKNGFTNVANAASALWNIKPSTTFQDAVTTAIINVDLLGEGADKAALKFGDAAAVINTAFTDAIANATKLITDAQTAIANLISGDVTTKAEQAFTALANSPAWDKLTQHQQDIVADAYLEASAFEKQATNFKAWADAAGKYADSVRKGFEDWQKQVSDTTQSFSDFIDKINAEASAVNLEGTARERTLALLKLEKEYREGLIPSMDGYLDRVNKINGAFNNLDAQNAIKKQTEEFNRSWTDAFKSVTDGFASFVGDLVQNGNSAFKDLWNNFKVWALEAFAKIAAQQIILNITAGTSLAGAATNAFAGQNSILNGLLGGGGSGGLTSIFGSTGSLVQGISNIFSSGGIFNSGLGAAFAGSSLGQSLGLSALAEFSTGATALTTFGTVLGSAIPVLGAIVAAAGLLGAFSHGGPKTGGSAAGGIDLTSGGAPDVSGIDRYFTPNQADSTVKQIVDSVTQTYQQVAQQIGLTTGSAIFSLGFDEDPQGTANSRVSGGAFVNGQQVFNQRDVDAGQGDTNVQADLALEAQRALLAALQASDLPTYLASIFKSVDAASATADQITQIISTAEALRTAVQTVAGLGDQFVNLDPTAIEGLISSFGGLQNFTTAFQYIGANFETTADRMTQTQTQLNAAFAQLGLTVPKTHQQFLDLLNSLDLTTTAGEQTYAAMVSLAPAFIAVSGTADQAAQALQAQADANQKVIDSATSFLQSNFYGTAEAQAQKLATDAAAIATASAQLGVAIPTTLDGFRDLVSGIDQSTASGQALYNALIVLAPAVLDVSNAAASAATAATSAAAAINTAAQAITDYSGTVGDPQSIQANVSAFLSSIATIAGNIPNSDFGAQLGFQINLITEKIAEFQAKAAIFVASGNYDYASNIGAQVTDLQAQNAKFADELGRYTTLTAQYGAATAKQLVDLQDSYAQQVAALSVNVGGLPDNADALSALKTVFDQQWAAIIAGTSTGVTGTIDQLQKLRDGIAQYLQGLSVGTLSPSTPIEKLQQAQTDFQNDVAKALGGDQGALGDVTKFADTLLSLGRDFYSSGSQYADLYNSVTSQLGLVARTTPTGDPLTAQSQLALALPANGGKMASAEDIAALKTDLIAALTAIGTAQADAGTADAATVRQEVSLTRQALVDAITNGLK